MRAIDGDALEELFREVIGGIAKKPEMNGNMEHMVRASAMVVEMIKDAPTIDPQRTGRWIPQDHNKSNGMVSTAVFYYPKCSECGHSGNYDMNFCPNCGARMEGE